MPRQGKNHLQLYCIRKLLQNINFGSENEIPGVYTAEHCYCLKRISGNLSAKAAMSAYYACVYSRVRYGVIFWADLLLVEADRIFKIQKVSVRACGFSILLQSLS